MKYVLILAVLAMCSISSLKSQDPAPNILLIIADDLGIDAINSYLPLDDAPVTPHLDQIRDAGIRFDNTWATPQCTPTRAAIMSGKYGIKTGVMRPPGNLDTVHQSLFRLIQDESPHDYAGAVIGKWHISGGQDNFEHPRLHGVPYYEGLFTSSVDNYYAWPKVKDESSVLVEEYATTHLTDLAIDWLGEQNNPWFLWLAHIAPHGPFHVPPDGLYTREDVSNNQGQYYAMIEAMDHEIGRLLASLDAETRENTIIIFIGDNGTPGGVRQFYPAGHAKSSIYEGGLRVPMYISGKGVERVGVRDSSLTQVTDLYATIAELTGVALPGGRHNSLSLKPLLACEGETDRAFNYSDYDNDGVIERAIRNENYKLIIRDNGEDEFFNISADLAEENNLIDNLTSEEEMLKALFEETLDVIEIDWFCEDGIQNGDEEGIDACNNACDEIDDLSSENIGCCTTSEFASVFYEFFEDEQRKIYTSGFPNHDYCFNNNNIPEPTYRLVGIDKTPTLADQITSVVRDNGRPAQYFGIATNGVIFAPAPAAPFIFENQNTGEYNWDWVFEPTTNQGDGQDRVRLDCASAHTGPQGYHYHGEMFQYLETEIPGITTSDNIPQEPIHIGWASDGFPVVYKFGPDLDGNMKELSPSFQLRSGLRPGDGISAPCGFYSGKYTRDFEYVCGKGDLDECNGINIMISITTADGLETFPYYYVITSEFPQIPRCMKGNVSPDFSNGAGPLDGEDMDGDGFIEPFDCDDTDPTINPLAEEIEGNDIDENCDGEIITAITSLADHGIVVSPIPASDALFINGNTQRIYQAEILAMNGVHIKTVQTSHRIDLTDVSSGLFIMKIYNEETYLGCTKIIIQK